MFETPVLFIFFNRPEVVEESFKAIQLLSPSKLYLACDGPRDKNPLDVQKIEECKKKILSMIDWDCSVKTRFQEKNLGCSLGVSTSITWLFENEEKGIILEDDCIPDQSFFYYCDELLKRYKDDDRIGMIAGYNQLKRIDINTSYTFSKYKACWGWATWKRAWKNFDLSMKWNNGLITSNVIANMGYKGKDVKYWLYRIKLIKLNEVSAWDWQWYFSLSCQNQLCIFPKVNLISNIGFGSNATHTTINAKSIDSFDLSLPLSHPDYILSDSSFDKRFYKKNNTLYYTLMRFIPIPVKYIIKKMLRRFL